MIGTDILSDSDLQRMVPLAWREAARCWQEYRAAMRDDSPDGRAVAAMLHDSAWSAEHYWRHLYDANAARGVRPSLPRESAASED